MSTLESELFIVPEKVVDNNVYGAWCHTCDTVLISKYPFSSADLVALNHFEESGGHEVFVFEKCITDNNVLKRYNKTT